MRYRLLLHRKRCWRLWTSGSPRTQQRPGKGYSGQQAHGCGAGGLAPCARCLLAKRQDWTATPYDVYLRFWEVLGGELAAASKRPLHLSMALAVP